MNPLQAAQMQRAYTALGLALGTRSVPAGRTFIRSVILNALVGANGEDRERFAAGRWGLETGERIVKAAVPAFSVANPESVQAAREFFALVAEASLLGRIANLRRVPFNVRMLAMTGGAQGYWVAEGKPAPVSRQSVEGSVLSPMKVRAIVCATKESMMAVGDIAENVFQADMVRAVTGVVDTSFIDPDNAGVSGESPASVSYGGTKIPSAGSNADGLREDIRALFAAYEGDLTAAVLITDPRTALDISLLPDVLGQTELTIHGGQLFGVPTVTSAGSPLTTAGGSITLVDASSVATANEGVEMRVSEEATLQMLDNPTNASIDGTATTMVSMFQTDSVALSATIHANWQVQGDGRVVTITGASYLGS